MRAIVAADPALIEPIPPVLAARTGGEAQIAAIYRGEDGAPADLDPVAASSCSGRTSCSG